MQCELAWGRGDHSSRPAVSKLGRKKKDCVGGYLGYLELPRPDHQVRGEGCNMSLTPKYPN